jgi:glycosyltransferase involved in cell wall biosynthesis
MRICLVGGIFGRSADYLRIVTATPETTLLRGLRRRGYAVESRGHFGPFDFDHFDVVHVHHLSYGALVAAGERGGCGFVFTPHLDRARSFAREIAMRYVMRQADAIVALSRSELKWQREKWSVRSERQVVIPNGVDSSTFSFAAPRELSNKRWRALYVGQLTQQKGIYDLVDAMRLVAEEGIDIALEIVYHVDAEETGLRKYVEKLGLKNVRLLGSRTPAELSQLYARSHFLVVPSRSMEALPSVITEATLVGRPIIATDVAAIREQVAGFGIITQPGVPAELARAITSMIRTYSSYATQAAAASRLAEERYSIERMLDAHAALYERVCALDDRRRQRRHLVVGSLGRYLAERSRGAIASYS